MQWFEYLIIILTVLFVITVTIFAIYKKIKGETSCGGSCSGCKISQKECPAVKMKDHLNEYIESK